MKDHTGSGGPGEVRAGSGSPDTRDVQHIHDARDSGHIGTSASFQGGPRALRHLAVRGVRSTAGLAAGAVTTGAVLLAALPAVPVLIAVLAVPRARRADRVVSGLTAPALLITRIELRRLDRLCGIRPPADFPPERALRYAVYRLPLGLLGGVITGLMGVGLFWFSVGALGWLVTPIDYPLEVVATGALGAFLLVLTAQGVYGTVLLEERLARHVLGAPPHEALRRRIDQLATSRSDVVDAVDEERRRIERDLHDGVQQRLVALGMLLGRARRGDDPERTDRLLRQALEENRRALAELREVAWRVHPAVLDEAGLLVALESIAERTPLPVDLGYDDDGDPPGRRAATVAYYVVSEAVTNVVKHAGATTITIRVHRDGDRLLLTVEDDGRGGADPAGARLTGGRPAGGGLAGGGLTGLARRIAALDGRFAVHSPPGGPTTLTAELPCA